MVELESDLIRKNLTKDERGGLAAYEKYKIRLLQSPDTDENNARMVSVSNCITIMLIRAKIIDIDKLDEDEHSVTKKDGTLKSAEEVFGVKK